MPSDPVQEVPGGVRVLVRVVPRASRTEVDGLHDGALRIRVKAPPVDGAANRELIRFVARTLGVPKRNVDIERGEQSRSKTVRVEGVPVTEARTRLGKGLE